MLRLSPGPALAWGASIATAAAAALLGPALASAFDSPLAPSAATLALLLGAALGSLTTIRERLAADLKRVSKTTIPLAIVLLGFGLDAAAFVGGEAALATLALVLLCMSLAFAATLLWGRLLGLDRKTSLLLSAGTAVCGNSAVMAVAPAVDPRDEDVALTVGVVNLLSVVLLFAVPALAGALGLAEARGGAVAGLTIHALPQALAAGESLGPAALEAATLTKLMRVSLLAPVVLLFTLCLRPPAVEGEERPRVGLPLYLILFLVAASARSLGWVDGRLPLGEGELTAWQAASRAGKLCLAVALAAIGAGLDVRQLVKVGPRVLLVGGAAVATLVAGALALVSWLL